MLDVSNWSKISCLTSRGNVHSISLASYNQLEYRVCRLEETTYSKEVIILVSKINASSYYYFARGRSYSRLADIMHK